MTQEVAQSVPDLIALAERCEQAIGPDCEIDRDMWLAIYGEGLASCRRAYTASLDAAQSLVPERWSISLHAHYGGESRASVYSGPMASGFCFGDTPALSLCAAALRARAEITRLQGVSL